MKDKKKLEMLLRVIQKVYDKNPEMQEVIDASMKKAYLLSRYFFILLFFCCCLYHKSFEVIKITYGNSRGYVKRRKYLVATGHILDLYCFRLSNAALFCKNYAKLFFLMQNTSKGERGWWGGVRFGAFFSKKCHFFYKKVLFLANIERCPKFLNSLNSI